MSRLVDIVAGGLMLVGSASYGYTAARAYADSQAMRAQGVEVSAFTGDSRADMTEKALTKGLISLSYGIGGGLLVRTALRRKE